MISRNYQEHAAEVRANIKQLLCGVGVRIAAMPEYQRFGLKLDKAKRTYSGETLIEYATALVESYAARGGLDRRVLVQIAQHAFTLDVR